MDVAKLAKTYLRNIQRVHPRVHEFRVVNAAEFRHVNHEFYRQVESDFVHLGFSKLGDIEDVTAAKSAGPSLRTFIRVMTDREHTTHAGFYHVAPNLLWRLAMLVFGFPSKYIELQSHSTDDCWLFTSNVPSRVNQPKPHGWSHDYAPRKLSPAQLYERHRETLVKSGRQFVRVCTIEDAIRYEVDQFAKKREHLVSIGWLTPEYLQSQGCPKQVVPAVYAESQRLVSEGFDASRDF